MLIFLLLLGLLLIILQMFLPEIHFLHARPYILPILVAYGAMRFDLLKAAGLAIGLGFILDLFSAGRMGVSCVSYLVMVFFIFSQSENFRFEFPPHILLLTLISIFLYLVADYLFFCVQIETWRWPYRVWLEMASQSLADTLCTLPLFWLFDFTHRWMQRTKKYV